MIKANSPPRIAVVGVSSLIGEAWSRSCARARWRMRSCTRSTTSATSAVRFVDDEGETRTRTPQVTDAAAFDFSRVDLVFFCGRAALAERHAQAAAEHAWVIDCSATFRQRDEVPVGGGRRESRRARCGAHPGAMD